jgi:prevent-host-death family protein
MSWQVQEAKQRFSEVLRAVRDEGPQTITRHGKEIAEVIDEVVADRKNHLPRDIDFGADE